ncbi:tetratricopeptide repeat family protein, putative [Plasmodium sp. DRC-Itaito]|nr:tetratricopeptide repeat family protein, putative [Plasmodium sp. DRC-Itaito]
MNTKMKGTHLKSVECPEKCNIKYSNLKQKNNNDNEEKGITILNKEERNYSKTCLTKNSILKDEEVNNIDNNDKNYNKVISDNKHIYDIHCETNDANLVDKKTDVHDKNNEQNCDINKQNLNNNITDLKLSDDDKETKDDANEKYNKGDYEGALKIWERGLRSINYVLSKRDELNPDRLEVFLKMHTTYCSNIAQGYMKINKYSECVKYSLLAQENDKNNIKIYFRLAKGYFMLGEYDKSIKVLNEGIKINKDTSLINLLKLVLKKKQTHLEKEKHMMKHIFQNLKQKPLINDDNNNKSFFYNISSSLKFIFIFLYAFLMKICNLVFGSIMDKFCKVHKR